MRKNILFLCTGNSCRSQMGEGWGRNLLGEKYNFYSAGTKKHGLNPYAIKVMGEEGVDISSHSSKTLDELSDISMDFVITVCSDAHETCPVFQGGKIIHHGFDDPPRLTENIEDENAKLEVYRRVCLEIKSFVEELENIVHDF